MPPQRMTASEFAAWIKKQAPEFANYPDDQLIQGVLARRPDLRRYVDITMAQPRAQAADTLMGRLAQAYRGELPVSEYPTTQGVGTVARDIVGAGKGLLGLFKPPSMQELQEASERTSASPTMLPIAILAARMGKPIGAALKGAP